MDVRAAGPTFVFAPFKRFTSIYSIRNLMHGRSFACIVQSKFVEDSLHVSALKRTHAQCTIRRKSGVSRADFAHEGGRKHAG